MVEDIEAPLVPAAKPPAVPAAAVATEALAAARGYALTALTPETLRAYAADWAHFSTWCATAGCEPLPAPPTAVAAYLATMAGLYSRSALERRLAAIGHQHRLRGLDWSAGHPAIRTTLRGIYRQHGSRRRQAAALTSVELRKLVAACPGDLAGLRDRALLLLGFAGALRRSELVGIDREHLRVTEAGLRVLLPRSKTDQGGKGGELGLSPGKRRGARPGGPPEGLAGGYPAQVGPRGPQ